jgi:hypothetical protein
MAWLVDQVGTARAITNIGKRMRRNTGAKILVSKVRIGLFE